MPKVRGDARDRLQQAALELFGDGGYDRTTSAEIAARAGVTERTFFRHFADKREVLFDGEATLRAALTTAIDTVPATLGPLDTLLTVFCSVAPMIEANRPFAEPRQRVIAATPALQERELAKLALLTSALAAALQTRGVDRKRATLAAHTGMAAFVQATLSWFDEPQRGLRVHLDWAFAALRELAGQTPFVKVGS